MRTTFGLRKTSVAAAKCCATITTQKDLSQSCGSTKRMYPAISLKNLSWLSTSIVNGTHVPAEKGRKGGIAITAHPNVKTAIGDLCSVRRSTIGSITRYLRAEHATDLVEATQCRKRKAADKYASNVSQSLPLILRHRGFLNPTHCHYQVR